MFSYMPVLGNEGAECRVIAIAVQVIHHSGLVQFDERRVLQFVPRLRISTGRHGWQIQPRHRFVDDVLQRFHTIPHDQHHH